MPLSASEVVASLDRHFRLGVRDLSTSQLADHKRLGFCLACEELRLGLHLQQALAQASTPAALLP